MKNKKIIIGTFALLTVLGYFYFTKKKNDLKKPYTDAELDNALNGFINKVKTYLKSKGKSDGLKNNEEILPRLKYRFEQAELKQKDVSRKNVDKILNLLFIDTLEREGDITQGVLSQSQKDKILDFMGESFYKYFE
jgi:hypothetical protein